jgi:hypothetical protein
MSSIPRDTFLFTRGSDSVRLVREHGPNGCLLFVYGPATKTVTHAFPNTTDCMKRQAEIEQKLLAEGYQLARPSSDRRSELGTWDGLDHRRAAG